MNVNLLIGVSSLKCSVRKYHMNVTPDYFLFLFYFITKIFIAERNAAEKGKCYNSQFISQTKLNILNKQKYYVWHQNNENNNY